eukprot:8325334-Ditylum_brightwellii.AAC.1
MASWNHTMRDVMVKTNITLGSKRKNIVITMVFAIMTQRNVTSIKLTGSMFSPLTDTKRCAKKCNLSAKEVKDLNMFVKDKIDEKINQCNCNMHKMSNFKDLSISSSDKSIQSIIGKTSIEGSDNKNCKLASKK